MPCRLSVFVEGCSRAVLWLHFLASLQNGADSVPNADSLTPVQVSQALLRDRVAKTSTLKRFFEVDDVPDGSQHRMLVIQIFYDIFFVGAHAKNIFGYNNDLLKPFFSVSEKRDTAIVIRYN